MAHYTVTWKIDFDVDGDPIKAAKEAQDIMQDRQFDWKFEVTDEDTGKTVEVDLDLIIAEEIVTEITGVRAIQTVNDCKNMYPDANDVPSRECQICKAFRGCLFGKTILLRANVTRSE
jgi:hypothetical protein